MSDISASQEPVVEGDSDFGNPDADAVVESDGTTDEGVGEGEAPPVFDWQSYSDQIVTITVDGEEVQVPLREAMSGYSRQADYTRKTQALAQEREGLASMQALRQALDADPRATLAALASAYDVPLGVAAQAVELDDELDPIEARFAKYDEFIAKQEAEAQRQAVIASARTAVKEAALADVSEEQLLKFAVDNQIGDLNRAAQFLKWERAEAERAKREEATTRKRQAAVVEGGGSTAAARQGTSQPIRSLRDAFEAAKKQHGITDVSALLG